ncbi:hypothetical protein [Lentibacter sp. XHP0401]|uniref:hypothetical protein n=1 Tax=Lentibacter sp. XHP0401 TaxID=2984334 RepID=UPI0021E8304F|nr:hypothetical protein [Lentibacter sp. XHP0401]MCV2894174.1 hypothetical protein [Lentibacter sp. XHP0401]
MSTSKPQRINVEFVSAYPSRPLRGEDAYAAIIGDVLARMAAALGHEVTREYYVNDTGPQADALARGVYARCLAPAEFEPDEITALAATVRKGLPEHLFAASEADWLTPVRRAAVNAAMASIRVGLAALDVHFDTFTHESSLETRGKLAKLLSDFAQKDALMDSLGTLVSGAPEKPTGRLMLDTASRGDLRPRPLTDANGSYTYYAGDLAYHSDKLARGYDLLIDVFRKDHSSYAPGLVAGVDLMSAGKARLSVCLIDPVRPATGEEPSPRVPYDNGLPSLDALLDFYGAPLLRRLFLAHEPGTPLELVCDPAIRATLERAAETTRAAFELPVQAREPSTSATEALTAAFVARSPHMLMAAADDLASACLKANTASPQTKETLSRMQTALGL